MGPPNGEEETLADESRGSECVVKFIIAQIVMERGGGIRRLADWRDMPIAGGVPELAHVGHLVEAHVHPIHFRIWARLRSAISVGKWF
jgi:hypothetical protein